MGCAQASKCWDAVLRQCYIHVAFYVSGLGDADPDVPAAHAPTYDHRVYREIEES